jgi:hypothetical protein
VRRLALILLLAVALLLRLAAPAGWMPGRADGAAGLVACPGAVATHHRGHKPDHGHAAPQPCAFSGLFAATAEPFAAPLTAPAMAPAPVPPARAPAATPGRGLAAPPPPSHAPPIRLA